MLCRSLRRAWRHFFFFNDTATTEIYTLSLHDALPIWMFSVLVIRLRSLRLLRVSGIVMRLRMFLLLITFLKASHSFRNRLLVICKNAYLTIPLTRSEERFSRNAETDLVCRLLLEKKKE